MGCEVGCVGWGVGGGEVRCMMGLCGVCRMGWCGVCRMGWGGVCRRWGVEKTRGKVG